MFRLIGWLFAALLAGGAAAEPFVPDRDDQVLERLPVAAADPRLAAIRPLRQALDKDPDNLQLAVDVARRYIQLGRAEADPRYYGYAQAALAPWWDQADAPGPVRVLRATLYQNRHHFDEALADLDAVLQANPRNAQAWLTRAVILTVRGEYSEARQSCAPLLRLVPTLLAAACGANAASLSGQAEAAYAMLGRTLQRDGGDPATRRWALTLLAEIAQRLGRLEAAQRHFQAALALDGQDTYLRAAYADFLLDRGRADEVVPLVEDFTRADALLLRLALAQRAVDDPAWKDATARLADRFAAAGQRGESVHLGEEARMALHLQDDAGRALALARRNWAVQREPRDARILLEAALAAGQPQAAREVLDHLRRSGLEDVTLQALARRLERDGASAQAGSA